MDYGMGPTREEKLRSRLEDVLGDIQIAEEKCPGVYYVAAHSEEDSYFAREYYLVAAGTPVIPQKAKKYGQPIEGWPGALLYSMQDERSGYKIIEYEIAKYRVGHGLPLPDRETLHEIKIYNMEYHPEYFGPYPVPEMTPDGPACRHHVIDNGVYWLEPERGGPLLAVCCPLWTELSDYAMKLSRLMEYDRKQGVENTLGYVFFSAPDSCIPIFELLAVRKEWKESGRINEAALMNAIWSRHPEYAAVYNTEEQAGLHDALGLLLKTFGQDAELNGSIRNMIRITPEEGNEFLHF